MKPWLAPAIIALSVAGCTTQMETRSNNTLAGSVIGVPYALPYAQHELTVTRTLVGCKNDPSGAIEQLEFETQVVHVPRYFPGERFVVDYRELGNWHKTSGFNLTTFPNQTLKAVNAEADDRSPETIGAAVKTVLAAARIATIGSGGFNVTAAMVSDIRNSNLDFDTMAALLPDDFAAVEPPSTGPQCPPEVEEMKTLSELLKEKSKELLEQTRKLEALVVPTLIGLATEEQKQEVQALRKSVLQLVEQQTALQRQYDTQAKRMRFVEAVTFIPASGRANQSHVFNFPGDPPALRTIQTNQLRQMFRVQETELPEELLELLRESATLSASLDATSEIASTSCDDAKLPECNAPTSPEWGNRPPKSIPGIAFRTPVRARLLVCQDQHPDACRHGTSQPMLLNTDVSVPQLGRLVILPFQNGFGANNRLEAVFREDGSLESLGYDEKEASGENLAGMLGDSAEKVLAYRKEQHEKQELELEEAKAAPGKALDDQIALLKKQQEHAELAAAQDPDLLAQEQELARLQAEIARLTALKQIKDLEAALAANAGSG